MPFRPIASLLERFRLRHVHASLERIENDLSFLAGRLEHLVEKVERLEQRGDHEP